jgi:hypothetical protein
MLNYKDVRAVQWRQNLYPIKALKEAEMITSSNLELDNVIQKETLYDPLLPFESGVITFFLLLLMQQWSLKFQFLLHP